MTSVLNVDTIAAKNGTSPVGLLKADTIKFRLMHSGDNPVVDDSLNLSSLVDYGNGNTYNFTNNFSNGFYTPTALSTEDASIGYVTIYYHRAYDTRLSSSVLLVGIDHGNGYDEGRWTSVHSSGDLA